MKLVDPFPCARPFKRLLCSGSNKGRLQKLICSYLTDIAQAVDAEIIHSVGSHCTKLSTQQPTALTSLRLTLSSYPLTQFCASQATVALLLLIPLIPMPRSRQRSSRSNCPVCSLYYEKAGDGLLPCLSNWRDGRLYCAAAQYDRL